MLQYLPPHLKDFIAREVAAGHYESEEQVIVVALERLADDDDDRITVAEAVAESRAAMDRGETFEMTDDFFQQARERAGENSRRGHRVSDDITY
ncbi:MAG TPA: type II toxin-antitoxin system ParD family antitoxin [Thermomicrobiales bacterium]|nr:type II toxin-antitoxin system ParD family antitoxin [Thermomicrobiales bacterium]